MTPTFLSSLQQPESPHRQDSLASLFPSEEEERKGGCGELSQEDEWPRLGGDL